MAINWVEIRQRYVQGTESTAYLAKIYKIDESNLKGHCVAENWVKLRKDFQLETDRKATEQAQKKAIETLTQKNVRRSRVWRNIAAMVTRRLGTDTYLLEELEAEKQKLEIAKHQKVVDQAVLAKITDTIRDLTASLFDTRAFRDLVEIFKMACLGERLEDGQPTAITKNENENSDASYEKVLRSEVLKTLNEYRESHNRGNGTGKASHTRQPVQDSQQKPASSPVPTKPATAPVQPAKK